MKKCKKCKAIIEISIAEEYELEDQLEVTNAQSLKEGLCIECYHKRRNKMKGNFKITVEITDDCGNFPITETITLNVDNTPEHIDTMVDYFKRILLMMGYHPNTVKDVFYNEEE